MTLFDILHIPETESPITFKDGRFYAYKNILLDLHNKIPIELQPLSIHNSLFKQLNISYSQTHYVILYPKNTAFSILEINIHHDLIVKYYENETEIKIEHHKPFHPSQNTQILKIHKITA
jgi:hypothetical protein